MPACTPEHSYDVADQVLGRAVAHGLIDELKGSAYAMAESLRERLH